jgi:uncharacterized protein YyaL (SSP411 family)
VWWDSVVPWVDGLTGRGRTFAVKDLDVHGLAALAWLERAQDASPDDGISRGYGIRFTSDFEVRGWQASYPETTGYIIPTLLAASRHFGRSDLLERARRAAAWESRLQLADGAVVGGLIGQNAGPAAFNTGQVIFGWLAAGEAFDDQTFLDSASRAGRYLVRTLDADGLWRTAASAMADGRWTLYNARTAWALAAAADRLAQPDFADAARQNLDAVTSAQHDNGWFPECCLNDAERPLLHTLAYTIRGLVESGWLLSDERYVAAGTRAAAVLAGLVDDDGWLPGRFDREWHGAVSWACLTGLAQMANVWLRLYSVSGEDHWLGPAEKVMTFLRSTHDLDATEDGIRGGIRGSQPIGGAYGPYQVLSWATKFFLDAVVRTRCLERQDADEARFLLLA